MLFQISKKTTWKKTVCLCNHLSWFGAGLIVKPNVLDLTKTVLKIKDLDDYPALLATVCIIAGMYIILMVLAGRQDKRDALKVSRYLSVIHLLIYCFKCKHFSPAKDLLGKITTIRSSS